MSPAAQLGHGHCRRPWHNLPRRFCVHTAPTPPRAPSVSTFWAPLLRPWRTPLCMTLAPVGCDPSWVMVGAIVCDGCAVWCMPVFGLEAQQEMMQSTCSSGCPRNKDLRSQAHHATRFLRRRRRNARVSIQQGFTSENAGTHK